MNYLARPFVCQSGLVIDWILTYAWYHQYLQHIRTINITGDVQPWVKEKWHKIFNRQARNNEACQRDPPGQGLLEIDALSFSVSRQDIEAIATIGK